MNKKSTGMTSYYCSDCGCLFYAYNRFDIINCPQCQGSEIGKAEDCLLKKGR